MNTNMKNEMEIIIQEPKDLYKSFRKEQFKNPLKWFLQIGYRFSTFLFVFGIISIIIKQSQSISYSIYIVKLIILSVFAALILYPLDYLGYRIINTVKMSNKDIWIKRNYKVIKYDKIKYIIIEQVCLFNNYYKKVILEMPNDKQAHFFIDNNRSFADIKEQFIKKSIPIQERLK